MRIRWSLAALAGLALLAEADPPRLGIVVLESPPGIEILGAEDAVALVFEETGRFDPSILPDSLLAPGTSGNLIPALMELASVSDLNVILALSIRPVEETERFSTTGDSLVRTVVTTVSVSGRFYSSSGTLLGAVDESASSETSLPLTADLQSLAERAASALGEKAILQVFPLEARFTAGDGSVVELPAGTVSGIHKGMYMSAVASAAEIPSTAEGYALLHSRGLLQVVSVGETSSRARLLTGNLVPGGPVTAVEHGAPASVRASWEMLPMDLEQEADSTQPDESGVLNSITIGVSSFRWGLVISGALHAGAMENLSNVGVSFELGWRIPVSAPSLALVLAAGGEVDFLVQDVVADYLVSDGTAMAGGGLGTASLEYLPSDHLGLTLSLGTFLGSNADSWTVQSESGEVREAEPSELNYSTVGFSPLRLSAGMFYLIY
jgi:hypothetical protein